MNTIKNRKEFWLLVVMIVNGACSSSNHQGQARAIKNPYTPIDLAWNPAVPALKRAPASLLKDHNQVTHVPPSSKIKPKQWYFLAQREHYFTLSGLLGLKIDTSWEDRCPAFHLLLQREKVNRGVKADSIGPIAPFLITGTPPSINQQLKNRSLEIRDELKQLCQNGESLGAYLFSTLMMFHQNDGQFFQKPQHIKALFKNPVIFNYLMYSTDKKERKNSHQHQMLQALQLEEIVEDIKLQLSQVAAKGVETVAR